MKRKEKTILCMLMATVFLMPLMGNTVVRAGMTTGCFSDYDINEAWETNPENMNCNENTYASTTIDGDVELLTDIVTTSSISGTITKVEIRAKGYYDWFGNDADIILRPVFRLGDGDNHIFDAPPGPPGGWSDWFEITNDNNSPRPWTATDVYNLNCDVEADGNDRFTLYCSKVEIRVTSI